MYHLHTKSETDKESNGQTKISENTNSPPKINHGKAGDSDRDSERVTDKQKYLKTQIPHLESTMAKLETVTETVFFFACVH